MSKGQCCCTGRTGAALPFLRVVTASWYAVFLGGLVFVRAGKPASPECFGGFDVLLFKKLYHNIGITSKVKLKFERIFRGFGLYGSFLKWNF